MAPASRFSKRADTGESGAGEHPCSAEPIRHAFDCRALAPVRHIFTSLTTAGSPANTLGSYEGEHTLSDSISQSPAGFPPPSSAGSRAAAARTSSLPVTTSAMRRVRYSCSSSICPPGAGDGLVDVGGGAVQVFDDGALFRERGQQKCR